MSKGNKKQQQRAAEAVAPFLGRELRVELVDGRVIVGTLLAYEGSGDLLFQAAIEERRYKDEQGSGVTLRGVNLLAVPFKCIKALHRRTEGAAPLMAVLEQEVSKAAAPVAAEATA